MMVSSPPDSRRWLRSRSVLLFLLLILSYSGLRGIRLPFLGQGWNSDLDASSPSSSNNAATGDTKKEDKPLFVLHVGPPKTATTFLQTQLCWKPDITEPLLLQDNLVYLGTCQFCSSYPQYLHGGEGFPALFSAIDELYAKGHGGIYSNEVLSHAFGEKMQDKVELLSSELNSRFRVKVLIGHRSVYEWLPSWYNQLSKVSPLFTQWPGVRQALPYIPFDPYGLYPYDKHLKIAKIKDSLHQVVTDRVHWVQKVADLYAPYFDDVSILPLENLPTPKSPLLEGVQVNPLLSYIFCDLLSDETPATCRAVRKGQLEPPPYRATNPSVSFNYDMIAVEAYQAGLIPNIVDEIQNVTFDPRSRVQAAERVRQRQEEVLNQTSTDFPLECLSNETLRQFEALSLEVDRNLFGDQWNSEWEDRHHTGFWKAREKLFCWVNASQVLEDPGWRGFFSRRLVLQEPR